MNNTIESLRPLAEKYIGMAKQQLTGSKNLMPIISLLNPADGSGDLISAIDGNIMNIPEAKDALAKQIKGDIKAHGFTASVMISDTFMAKVNPEKEQEVLFLHRELHISLDKIAKLMPEAVTVQESILISIETSDGQSELISTPYTRDADGNVTGFGEPTTINDSQQSGRFRFFGD